jgi:hypothetical protein
MDQTERQIIDDLFAKLREAEAQSGPRDAQAEAHIRDHVARLPAAPYLMSQAIVIQEQALAAAQARIQQLERELTARPAGGGFLAGLFGGKPSRPAAAPAPFPGHAHGPANGHAGSPWGQPPAGAYGHPHHRQGGGFMAGAMQTAMGVAGGMLIGNMLADAFSGGGEAMAQEAASQAEGMMPDQVAYEDAGFEDGGFDEEI